LKDPRLVKKADTKQITPISSVPQTSAPNPQHARETVVTALTHLKTKTVDADWEILNKFKTHIEKLLENDGFQAEFQVLNIS
jgi:hypothetical protein